MSNRKSDGFFNGVASSICSSLHLEAAMKNTLNYLSQYMPVDEMYMGTFDYKSNLYHLTAKATSDSGVLLDRDLPVSEEAFALIREFDHHFPRIVASYKDDAVLSCLIPDNNRHSRSCLVIPLTIDNKLVGSCQLHAWGRNKYTQEHAEMLKPLSEVISMAFSHCLEHLNLLQLQKSLKEENKYLKKKMNQPADDLFIGKSGGLKNVFDMISLVAPLNSPVLITGDTGTGKELVANSIYRTSDRKDGPYVRVNCGAIPQSLMDSELFGHEKGSFTGAINRKLGRFERADKGTIFLDEIGELTADAQVRLLRVIQEKEIERIGGTEPVPVDIRIICATHRNLEEMVQKGSFREDLFFRINVFPIHVPPLRERKEDIPELCHYFLQKKSKEFGLSEVLTIRDEDMSALMNYKWPGNVRELQNVIERALILRGEKYLNFSFLK